MESAGPSAKRKRLAAPEASEAPDPKPTSKDSISHLPDDLLGEIISLLPTKDGARTQTLASRWRHLWRAAPLNLDCCGLSVDDKFSVDGDYVLPSAILAAHQGTGRRLRVPARCLHNRPATVDAWLRSPALHNLEELEFYYVPKYREDLISPLASLPTSIFRFSSTLCIATISQCILQDGTVETLRFPLLRKLAFVRIQITERSLQSIITTGCPVLECLLLRSLGVPCIRINSPCIRVIGVRDFVGELIIEDAPLLESLIQLGSCFKTQMPVISAPKLETLGPISGWGKIRVVFGSTIIQGLRIENLITVVRSVKILAVCMHTLNLDVVIDLMRCFPCLEKLYIKADQSAKTNFWRRKHRNFLRCSEIRLKTIALGYYRGIRAQVNFATFFVLNAPLLDSMRLEIGSDDYNDGFFAQQHDMLQMEKRPSRGARLYFTKYYEHNKDCQNSISRITHASDLDLTNPFECCCRNLGFV